MKKSAWLVFCLSLLFSGIIQCSALVKVVIKKSSDNAAKIDFLDKNFIICEFSDVLQFKEIKEYLGTEKNLNLEENSIIFLIRINGKNEKIQETETGSSILNRYKHIPFVFVEGVIVPATQTDTISPPPETGGDIEFLCINANISSAQQLIYLLLNKYPYFFEKSGISFPMFFEAPFKRCNGYMGYIVVPKQNINLALKYDISFRQVPKAIAIGFSDWDEGSQHYFSLSTSPIKSMDFDMLIQTQRLTDPVTGQHFTPAPGNLAFVLIKNFCGFLGFVTFFTMEYFNEHCTLSELGTRPLSSKINLSLPSTKNIL